nr:immunoglobulin light chain junction region [Macaca mulatta]
DYYCSSYAGTITDLF